MVRGSAQPISGAAGTWEWLTLVVITILPEAPPAPGLGYVGEWSVGSPFASRPPRRSPGQRTEEELELIFEELLHIKAVAHLSNSVGPQACPPAQPFPQPLPVTPQEAPAAGPEGTSLPFGLWLGNFQLPTSLSGNTPASLSPLPRPCFASCQVPGPLT